MGEEEGGVTLPGLALVSVLMIMMLADDNDTDTQRHTAGDNGEINIKDHTCGSGT